MAQQHLKYSQLQAYYTADSILHVNKGFLPAVMRILDACQLGQSIKKGYVSCSHLATANKVVKCTTDIYHHVRGRGLLSAIFWQY